MIYSRVAIFAILIAFVEICNRVGHDISGAFREVTLRSHFVFIREHMQLIGLAKNE